MGDKAKPFTSEVLNRAYASTVGFERLDSEGWFTLRATVEALEAERAKVKRLREALEEVAGRERHSSLCSAPTVDGLTWGCVCAAYLKEARAALADTEEP